VTYGLDGRLRWSQRITPEAVQWTHATSGAWVVGDRVGAGYYVYENGFGNWADAPSFDVATGEPKGPLGDGPIVAVRDRRVVSTFRRDVGSGDHEAGVRVRDLDTGQVTLVAHGDEGGFTLGEQRLYRAFRSWVGAYDPAPSGEPTVLWERGFSNTVTEPVLNADESVVYVVASSEWSHSGDLIALDAATGATLWSNHYASTVSMPALTGDTLYIQTGSGWLNAYLPTGCATACPMYWQSASGSATAQPPPQPAVAGDVIYTGWGDGSVSANERSGGDQLWSGSAGEEPVIAGPVVSGGRVYVATADGALTAFGL
jgi:outer membrane protein assembly factor BamB